MVLAVGCGGMEDRGVLLNGCGAVVLKGKFCGWIVDSGEGCTMM